MAAEPDELSAADRRIPARAGPEIVFHDLDQRFIESPLGGGECDADDIDDPAAAGEQQCLCGLLHHRPTVRGLFA